MEEEKDENSKRTPVLLKQNTLEKLIKMDIKNSSLSPFNKKNRRRLLLRDQALNSDFSWAPNQVENSLYAFWNHIDQYYFKHLKDDDIEQIDFLMETLDIIPYETPEVKYNGFEAYEAFDSIISPEYKKMIAEKELATQNNQNLKKKYFISTMKPADPPSKSSKNHSKIEQFEYDTANLKAAKRKGKLKGFLQEETKQLDEYLESFESKTGNKKDEIDKEIEKINKEYAKINKNNLELLAELKDVTDEPKILDIQEILNSCQDRHHVKVHPPMVLKRTKGKGKIEDPIEEAKIVMMQYLKNVIVRLENHQAAESIKYVIDCKKPVVSGEKYKFCVIFDEALSNAETWVDEPTLDNLDKLREQSLFKVYKIPQKISYSMNASNLAAFSYCNQVVEHRVNSIKEKPWKDLIKKGFLEGSKNFSKEELFAKSKEFGLCHHCKHLFPEEFLLKCSYRTSELKPPTMTTEFLNPFASQGPIPKRSIWNNKRSINSFYKKKNGELVCLRAYCRLCLKQNFQIKKFDSNHWICPFCDGTCNCTRCLRSDRLNKLISLYSILGGDLKIIKQESCLERYVYPSNEDLKLKTPPKSSYFALKPTRGSKVTPKQTNQVKGRVREYKGNLEQLQSLKDMRVKLERMRILFAQAAKKERQKMRFETVKSQIREDERNQFFQERSKAKKYEKLDLEDFEPLLTKKLKTLTGEIKSTISKTRNLLQRSRDVSPTLQKKGKKLSKLQDKMAKRSYIKKTIQSGKVGEEVKRKRGRPRKDEQKPRKVGRPRKNEQVVVVKSVKKKKTGTGRPVGRPKGSKNKKTLEREREEELMQEQEEISSGDDDDDDDAMEIEEDEDESDYEGDEIEEEEESEQAESDEETELEYDGSESEDIEPPKITRRKESVSKKGKRGRKKKVEIVNPNEPNDDDEEYDESEEENFDEDDEEEEDSEDEWDREQDEKKQNQLKKELRKIYDHQPADQFEIMNKTLGERRVTRSGLQEIQKSQKKGRNSSSKRRR